MRTVASIALSIFLTSALTAQVRIMVESIPSETPPGDPIHIAGNFQGWDPGDPAFELAYDSTENYHHITLDSGLGSLAFKFTRGDWSKVESDENGNYIPDRSLPPSDGDTVTLSIAGWEDLTSGGGSGQTSAADNVEIISDSFYIPQFDRYRRVWIYLPKGYETSGLDYPVLYMHDGQNVFDQYTSFAGEWEVDETLNKRYDELGDEGIIVVAIDNGGNYRIDEYSPWSNSSYGGGDGEMYYTFLVETLKPYIDEQFRTLSDRMNTGLMGSSLGGLISTYGVLIDSTFSKIGSFSPAYWFNPEIFDLAASTPLPEDVKIYQVAGSSEGGNIPQNMFLMEDTLLQAGMDPLQIKSIEHSDGQHSEWYWAREFEDAYVWLFKGGTTGVEEDLTSERLNVFPNPVHDQLVVSLPNGSGSQGQVSLTDLSGRILQTHQAVTGQERIRIELSDLHLANGVYIIHWQSDTINTAAKFVLQRP